VNEEKEVPEAEEEEEERYRATAEVEDRDGAADEPQQGGAGSSVRDEQ